MFYNDLEHLQKAIKTKPLAPPCFLQPLSLTSTIFGSFGQGTIKVLIAPAQKSCLISLQLLSSKASPRLDLVGYSIWFTSPYELPFQGHE